MTNHSKTYMEPKDIIAIRFECMNCQASVSIPITDSMNYSGLRNCPSCGRAWTVVLNNSIEEALYDCTRGLREVAAALKEHMACVKATGTSKGFSLSLELAATAAPASDAKD